MYEGEERRRYKRIKTEVRVDVEKYEYTPMMLSTTGAASKDVSKGGLLIRLKRKLEPGSMILARFSLPHEKSELEIVARVVRCEESQDFYEIGIEFLDNTPEESDKISKYVETESGRFKKS